MLKKLFLCASICLGSVFLVACGPDKPEDVALSFMEHIKNNNLDKAVDLLDMPPGNEKKAMGKDKIQMIADDINRKAKEKEGFDTIKVKSVETDQDGGISKVTLTYIFKNGDTKDDRFNLVSKDKKWKIKLN